MKAMRFLTVDLGASTGKVCVFEKRGTTIKYNEMKRFPTRGLFLLTDRGPMLFWNLPRFFEEVLDALDQDNFVSVGVDAWGVDFGLFDAYGRLLGLPLHYRDVQNKNTMNIFPLDLDKLFQKTGIQPMPINSLFRLYSMVVKNDPLLQSADVFLMIPDIINYWLTGEKSCEYTIATTSQCFSVLTNDWAYDVLDLLNIPRRLFPPVTRPGMVLGHCVCGRYKTTKVIATASHDTAAAISAIPFEKKAIYISLGTWALVGIEIEKPILTREARIMGFTNEGGTAGLNFHANKPGLWLVEECNKEWRLSHEQIVELACAAPEFVAFFDPEDPLLFEPGDMVNKLLQCLRLIKTKEGISKDVGMLARCIFENLAFCYQHAIQKLEYLTKTTYDTIHIVGGGARNQLLCQFIADVTGKTIVVGPYEATSIGNALVQLIGLEEIGNIAEGREIVSRSFSSEIKTLEPKNTEIWEKAYRKWVNIVEKS